MKISVFFCFVTCLILFNTIGGNASSGEKNSSSSISITHSNGENCLTRLDHVESKVELQRYELDQIKHEHKELKAMVLVLKNDRKPESDKIEASLTTISPDENLSNFDNRNPAKRPARLLPYRVLLKPLNKTGEEIHYKDPPTNCQDLRHIGYTLSGFYLVQFSRKIGMIYCNFKQYTGILEKSVGVMNIKSSPIHFYVQRKSNFNLVESVITFEVALLNEGRAMNLTTGVFRAPVNGIYYFSFRGFPSTSFQSPVFVNLRVNGAIKATSTAVYGGITLSIECTLKLKIGDQVDVKKGRHGTFEDNNIEHLTHFSGSLLEEDIFMI